MSNSHEQLNGCHRWHRFGSENATQIAFLRRKMVAVGLK
jgi:hypothetical protein